uniref:Uncharacterized protein n=1 Tax=Arundo donax TaxID=35708 RepID=A0A0A9Q0B4_ARUDO
MMLKICFYFETQRMVVLYVLALLPRLGRTLNCTHSRRLNI